MISAALLAATLVGCGGSAPPSALTARAASQLRVQLDRVRTSAAAGDARGATRALDAFGADVTRQRSTGRLSASEFAALETGIERTRRRIAVEVLSPSMASSTIPVARQPTAPPVVEPPGKRKDQGQAKDHGPVKDHGPAKDHGKGKGHDEG